MKRFVWLLLTVLLAGAAAGCGSDREKGMNKDIKDLPRETPTTPEK
jgi:hypothetical protein